MHHNLFGHFDKLSDRIGSIQRLGDLTLLRALRQAQGPKGNDSTIQRLHD